MPDYDLIVIGAGPGGYTAAIRGAQLSMKTAIIEKDSLGGVCTNWGCIPSKAILHSAEVVNLFKEAPELGITFDNMRLDLARAIDRSRTVVSTMVSGIDTLLKQNKITLIQGTAKLTGPTSITVSPGGEKLTATNVIVATGGVSRSLPNIPIDGDRVMTSREALDLREMPHSVVIVGGGPIGVEFAYFWRSFGAEVTIVELLDRILPNEDEDVSRALERAFRAQGIELRTGTGVESVEVGEGGVMVKVAKGSEKETIPGDRVLIGVGFGPNTEGLGLNDIGVTLERGFVKIDDVCRTNLPGLWAIGDVTGRLLLAHVATAQGVAAVETMAGHHPPPLDYVRMPRAVYCQPQVASLGLTEKQARDQGMNIRTSRFPFRANGKAVAIGATDGFVKLVVDWDTHDIVGYHAIGYAATEMISEASVASVLESTPESIGYTVHPHPTLSEVMHEAALAISGEAINFYAPRRDS